MKKIKIKILLCGLILVFSGIANAQNREQITIETLLKEMVNRDAIARFPKSDFRLKQQSSYSRLSKNPQDSVGWFNNHDNNSKATDHNFVRIEENEGKKEWVLMEDEGSGVIVRSWMPFLNPENPNTDIQIRIYLDGNKEPALEGNMLGLFNGTGLIPYPFAHKSLRSSVSFFPIPYAKSCKITTTAMPFFFQFTYQKYPKGTSVKTFTIADFNKSKPLIEQIGKTLVNPQDKNEGKKISIAVELNAKQEKSIDLPKGNAAVRSFSVKLSDYKDSSITRSIIVKMEFDGEQTVWCPIGDFFGTGIGFNPVKGWYTAVDEDGTMSAKWVMPYQKSGKITIENLGEKTVNVQLKAEVGTWKWDEQSMYFNAAWRGQYPLATRPFSDWNYITLKGRGVYVGDALTIMNPYRGWWGEGDEKIWVDGENFPSIFGTGTEDYYGYSWGGESNDFYEHPFHAQSRSYVYNKLNPRVNGVNSTLGYSTEIRTRSLDTMPFGTALKLDMEVWAWKDAKMGYGVGVYWYGDKNTVSNRKPDAKEALNVPPLPEGFPKVIK